MSWYCEECSEGKFKFILCMHIRANEGKTKTCCDIRHGVWGCAFPSSYKRRLSF